LVAHWLRRSPMNVEDGGLTRIEHSTPKCCLYLYIHTVYEKWRFSSFLKC
jgi:hypothetical protein